MGKKRRNQKRRKERDDVKPSAQQEEAYRPKAGPGQQFVRELIDARQGHAKRLRNVGEHPLTLAHARGRISDAQFHAGEHYRDLYEKRGRSGRDSTQPVIGGGSGEPWAQQQVDAIRALSKIERRLTRPNRIIVKFFCGEGWSMAQAVHQAVRCHQDAILSRVCEALDDLDDVIGGRRKRRMAA